MSGDFSGIFIVCYTTASGGTGYDDVDSEKGIYKFYWSGLNSLWKKDKPFGFKKDELVDTYLNGVDGPYIYGDTVFNVDENSKLQLSKLSSNKSFTVKTLFDQLPNFKVAFINDCFF